MIIKSYFNKFSVILFVFITTTTNLWTSFNFENDHEQPQKTRFKLTKIGQKTFLRDITQELFFTDVTQEKSKKILIDYALSGSVKEKIILNNFYYDQIVQNTEKYSKMTQYEMTRSDDIFNLIYKLAEQNDFRAQFNIGYMYQYGIGTKKIKSQASNWYDKALKNCKESQKNIFELYNASQLVLLIETCINQKNSLKILEQCAICRFGFSRTTTAEEIINKPITSLKDFKNTLGLKNLIGKFNKYLKTSDTLVDLDELIQILISFHSSLIVLKDDDVLSQAYVMKYRKYLEILMSLEIKLTKSSLFKEYLEILKTMPFVVNGQIDTIYKKPFIKHYKLARQNFLPALYKVALAYHTGEGVDKNEEESIEYFLKAAQQNHQEAKLFLNEIFYKNQSLMERYSSYQWLEHIFNWFLNLASQDNFKAQSNVSYMYLYGLGVPQSTDETYRWFDKTTTENEPEITFLINDKLYCQDPVAIELLSKYRRVPQWLLNLANAGNSKAQFNLGYMYLNGIAVTESISQAYEWFSKAAVSGDDKSISLLSDDIYRKNFFLIKYFKENSISIPQWLLILVDKSHSKAQFTLGYMYLNGIGVSENIAQAYKWFNKAATIGNKESMYFLNDRVYVQDLVLIKQLKKEKDVSPWLLRLAEEGNTQARFNLEFLYFDNIGLIDNNKESFEWFKEAFLTGNFETESLIDDIENIYSKNVFLLKNDQFEKIFHLANLGYFKTQYLIGLINLRGIGRVENLIEALKWFHKAAQNGCLKSAKELSDIYYKNRNFIINYDLTFIHIFNLATQHNNVKAQSNLGYMYYNGIGTDVNLIEADKWIEQTKKPDKWYKWYNDQPSFKKYHNLSFKEHYNLHVSLGMKLLCGLKTVDQFTKDKIFQYLNSNDIKSVSVTCTSLSTILK